MIVHVPEGLTKEQLSRILDLNEKELDLQREEFNFRKVEMDYQISELNFRIRVHDEGIKQELERKEIRAKEFELTKAREERLAATERRKTQTRAKS